MGYVKRRSIEVCTRFVARLREIELAYERLATKTNRFLQKLNGKNLSLIHESTANFM